MSIVTHHRPLAIADLSSPAVRAFDCGTEVWEVEINQWLRAEPDVLGGSAR